MTGAQIGALVNALTKNGTGNTAAPLRLGAIKARAAIIARILALAAGGCITFAI